MNLKQMMLGFGILALGVASAASSYEVVVSQPMWAGATELKPGTYKVSVEGSNAVFKSGKKVVEAPVTVEKGDRKVESTEMRSADSKIQEIRLAGTTTKLVFNSSATGGSSAAH